MCEAPLSERVTAPDYEVAWGAATDVGRRRAHNEDDFLAAPPIFLVADGMGGHARGEVASASVVDAFSQLAGRTTVSASDVRDAVASAQRTVAALQRGSEAPGSTLTGVAATVQDGLWCWLIFNVGDSRTYLMSAHGLEQISVDHSQVQRLLDTGELSVEQARTYSGRNIITQAIGAGMATQPIVDHWLVPMRAGNRLLLCSDGLTSEVTDTFIEATLLDVRQPQEAAAQLVDAAVAAGGRDNVTVVVVEVVSVRARNEDDVDASDTVPSAVLVANDLTVPDLTVPGSPTTSEPLAQDAR